MDIEQHYENLRSQGKLAEAKQFRIVSTRAMQDDQKKRMQALKDFYKALLSWGCGCCEKQLGCKIKENADQGILLNCISQECH